MISNYDSVNIDEFFSFINHEQLIVTIQNNTDITFILNDKEFKTRIEEKSKIIDNDFFKYFNIGIIADKLLMDKGIIILISNDCSNNPKYIRVIEEKINERIFIPLSDDVDYFYPGNKLISVFSQECKNCIKRMKRERNVSMLESNCWRCRYNKSFSLIPN